MADMSIKRSRPQADRTKSTRTSVKGRGSAPQPQPAPTDVTDRLHRRVVIERVRPMVDGGRFPIKRTPGEPVVVTAAVFADGHDVLAAVLRYRHVPAGRAADEAWQEIPMNPLGNDEWSAVFAAGGLGESEYTIEGWVDAFASWRKGLSAKIDAGQDVSSDLLEGAELLRAAAHRSIEGELLRERADILQGDRDIHDRITAALDLRIAELATAAADRSRATRFEPSLRVLVDRERARLGAWYEMFPRSAGTDPTRGATLREAEARLAAIAAMGFDVLYLPPVHPIGHTHRKGRNNSVICAPGDPGSPWAIGSEAGGHMAVDPGLGTLEDFDHFVGAAREQGLEVALDLAYQCSPDHPYVREHPEWFRHRPDGTIKYAENPPKKYQDIYPFDFECESWRELWAELRRIIEFWCAHGVRIFRVDNPHTKPFQVWEWALSGVRAQYPDVIFLSEAFTRPKIMRHLAKLGFDQSYTYFTWRNTREELIDYFTELTHTDVREYMRPNLFANTPDILHEFLQTGGPPAFRIRLVLASTLGASYGIYSGYELCENTPVRAGSEEYLDSEKYQVRVRDWTEEPNLTPLITRINRIRGAHPALHADWSLQFHATDNPQILCYSKSASDGTDRILVTVSLDPHHLQHGWVQIPPPGDGSEPGEFQVEDLLTGAVYRWRDEWNYVRLTPEHPAHIFRLPSMV